MSSIFAQTRLILHNDLRLLWRDLMAGKWRDYLSIALVVVLFAIANAIAISLFFAFRRQPPLGAETLAWLFFGFFMLSAAMNHAIKVLFERSDFDLLLSAPVSPRAILFARITAMGIGAAVSVALFLLPLLNGALLAVSPGYAAGYVVWLLLSCAVASAGVWCTLILVRWLGPRRARIWAQVLAALLGAGIYLVFQGQNFLPDGQRQHYFSQAVHALGQPLPAFVARAGRGEVLPLLALAAIAAIFTALTTRMLARIFIGGVQEGNAVVSGRRPSALPRRAFVEGAARATFWKDVRLIVRDPLLLAQVLPSALYILPLVLGTAKFGGVTLLGPVALVLTTQFSLALTAVSAAGEECWDLIVMSPTSELHLRVAKMAAGMALPVAIGAVLCLALAVLGHPVLALLGVLYSVGCAAAVSWLQVTRIKPTPRHDIMKRSGNSFNPASTVIAVFLMMFGAGGLGLAASRHWIVATILLGCTTLMILGCLLTNKVEPIQGQEFPSSGTPA